MHRKFIDGIRKIHPEYYNRMVGLAEIPIIRNYQLHLFTFIHIYSLITFQTPDDIPYLKSLVDQRIISTCPDYEDFYILTYAINHRAIVVSNDKYRDFPKRYAEHERPIVQRFLDSYVMPYAFTEDQFCPSTEFIYPDLIEEEEEEYDDNNNNEEEEEEEEEEEDGEEDYDHLAISESSELSERMHFYQTGDKGSGEVD